MKKYIISFALLLALSSCGTDPQVEKIKEQMLSETGQTDIEQNASLTGETFDVQTST